jgi:serine/threonine protein kinase
MSWEIPIGTEFAGYRVTGVIGRGGMSIVYSAEHLSLGRIVALKVLSAPLAADEDFRERFVRESKLAAALDHPNIIPIYDAGEADGRLFIAMRHVDGGDLGSLISPEAPLGLGQTIFFIEQVAGALDHAHRRGLVHRDVKPANILVATPSDRVYLTDFGVVKQADTPGLTKTGYFLGTFAYAAPEQIERRPIDGRTDLYSLGCVLHECLSGAPPFNAVTEASMLHAHLVEPPPRLTDVRPDLPHTIDNVIATALAKAKEDRYATCGELVAALRAVALGTSVEPPIPAAPRAATETVLARSEVRAADTPSAETPPAPSAPAVPPPAPPEPAALPPAEPAPSMPQPVASQAAAPPPAQPPPPAPPPAAPPAAAQPPEGAAPGAAAAPPAERRGVTLTHRRLALIGIGAVAVLAGAVVLAIVLTQGGNESSASSGGATTPLTTETASATGLAGVVPNPLFKYCEETTAAPGAAATATCTPPADANGTYYPDSWQFSLYANAAAVQKAYEDLRQANNVGQNFGRCNAVQWGGEGKWIHGPGKPGGSEFCYFDGDDAVIVWTHEKLGQPSHIDLLGTARSSGSDHSNLFNWYRFWHHRIGKCDTPDCVASL